MDIVGIVIMCVGALWSLVTFFQKDANIIPPELLLGVAMSILGALIWIAGILSDIRGKHSTRLPRL